MNSEKEYAFLATTAAGMAELTSVKEIYAYTAKKINHLLNDESILAVVEYELKTNKWKMQFILGIDKWISELTKLMGLDVRELEGEISSRYIDKITSGSLVELEFDFPGLFNNNVSHFAGQASKKLLGIDKMHSIAFQKGGELFGNITFITNRKTGPVNTQLIEAFIQQVSTHLKKQKAEESLKESEEKHRLLLKHLHAGVVVHNPDTSISYANQMASQLLGLSIDQLMGKTVIDPAWHFINEDLTIMPVNSYPAQYVVSTKMPVKNSILGVHRPGTNDLVWLQVNAFPEFLADGTFKQAVVTFIDITRTKQTERELQLKNRISNCFIQSNKDHFYNEVLDVLKDFFQCQYGLFGYIDEDGDFVAKSMTKDIWKVCEMDDKIPVFPKASWGGLWGKALNDKITVYQNENLKFPGGHVVLSNALAAPILTSQTLIGLIVLGNGQKDFNDETTQEIKSICEYIAPLLYSRLMEDKYNRELLHAKERAEESDRLKSAFLANMSHEIRTPMNGILGFAELLKEPGLSGEQQQHYIQIIEKSGSRMLNIINDIVNISRIEAGLVQLNCAETDLNEHLSFMYSFFKPEADAKGLEFTLRNSLPETGATIITDSEKLYAILTNLLKNALKYTHTGSIELGCTVTERADGCHQLNFYVKDTGIGIAAHRQKAIFERFIQADIEDRMAYQGAGLGLAISKAYAEMLGGTIGVESEEGRGSTFSFVMPCPPVVAAGSTAEVTGDRETISLPPLKVLVVEDDMVSGKLIDYVLKGYCTQLLKAGNGVEAVELCRTHPDLDLVLMDIRMPKMDGYEATRLIREFNTELVIIAQTAYGLTGDRNKALQAGFNDYISKPINKTKLLEIIQRCCK